MDTTPSLLARGWYRPRVTQPSDDTPMPPPASAAPSPAAQVYQSAVAEILDSRRPDRPYPPTAPTLTIVRHHRPQSAADLAPAEREQLAAVWGNDELAQALADEENDIEAAEVVDEAGTLRFRLYGWNFGVGYLFPPEGLELVAFGAQHDLEHWSLAQRDLFAGLDRAVRAGGHGFTQPLHFCWADDSCWEEIADAEPHSVGSEPYLRRSFGLA
jgi:hypothetical protein